jgi:Na+/melibiose symporter-like transporter
MSSNIRKRTVFDYSLIALPLAIIGLPLYVYLPTFYATTVGIDLTTVGALIFLARLSDVFTDPIFGLYSDKCLAKYKSRKPMMFIGALILMYSFYELINPSMQYPKTWLLIYSMFIYIGWSMIYIPYLTWSSELSVKYEDKTLLNSARELFTILGVLIALITPYLFKVSENAKETLDILYITFLVLFIPTFYITLKNIIIRNTREIKPSVFNLKNITKIYTNDQNIQNLQIGYFFNNLANALPATLFLLFIELVIQEKDSSGRVLILYFLSGIIAMPFWNILANKIGKKRTWICSIVLSSCAFTFVPFLQAGDLNAFIIISLISGLSLGADLGLPTSIQGDVVQKHDSLEVNLSGLLFGIWTMITKFSLSLAVVLSFGVLGFFDFDTSNPSIESLLVLSLLYGLLPVLLKIVSLFFIYKYKDE